MSDMRSRADDFKVVRSNSPPSNKTPRASLPSEEFNPRDRQPDTATLGEKDKGLKIGQAGGRSGVGLA